MRNNSSCTKMLLFRMRWPYKNFITLFTSNSKFRLNLTQRVTGSLVKYNNSMSFTNVSVQPTYKLIEKLDNEPYFLFSMDFKYLYIGNHNKWLLG